MTPYGSQPTRFNGLKIGRQMKARALFLKLCLGLSLLSPTHAQPPIAEALRDSQQEASKQITSIRDLSSDWFLKASPPQAEEFTTLYRGVAHWRADHDMMKVRPEWGLQRIRPYKFITSMWDACSLKYGITEAELYQGEWAEYREKTALVVSKSLLDMVASFTGRDELALSIDRFAKSQAGAKAQPEALWASLPSFQGKSWADILDPWTKNTGFPLVYASLVPNSNELRLRQMGFRLYPDSDALPSDRWLIPMAVRYEDEEGLKTHKLLLEKSYDVVSLPARGVVKWAYPNAGGTGFYRTLLSERSHQALLDFGFEKLSPNERVALVGNQWRLVRHGESSVALFLDLVELSVDKADDAMLALFLTEMDYLRSYEVDPRDYEAWNQFVRRSLRDLLNQTLSAKATAPHQLKSQARLLRVAALAGDPAAKAALNKRAAIPYLKGSLSAKYGPIHAAVSGNPRVLPRMLQELRQTSKGGDGYNLVAALAHSRDIELLNETLDTLLQRPDEVVDYAIWGLSAGSPEARKLGFHRLQEKWRDLPAFEGWLRAYSGGPDRHALLGLAREKNDEEALKILDVRDSGQFLTMDRVSGDIGDWLAEKGYGR